MYTVRRALSFPRGGQGYAKYECMATLARDLVMDGTGLKNWASNRQRGPMGRDMKTAV